MTTPADQIDDDRAAPATGSLSELALTVIRGQLLAVQAHEAGTRAGTDLEELHDMRVATRRLRAALKLFADVLPPAADAFRQELGWLGHGLAVVRDLDVQLNQLQAWRLALPEADRAGLDVLSNLVGAQRVQARQELVALLDSERYSQLVASGQQLTVVAPAEDVSGAVVAVMPDLIARPYRKLRRLGDSLDARSPSEKLHALRIRAKRLRYAVEFVAEVYGRPARRFLSRIIELQDLLGNHQDAQVARERLRATVRDRTDQLPNEAVFVMGELAERYADEAEDLRSRFEATYRRATGRRWQQLEEAFRKHRRSGPQQL